MYYTTFQSPLYRITLVGDEQGLQHLHLDSNKSKREFSISLDWEENDAFFSNTIEQINNYFSCKKPMQFYIRLNPQGTDYQIKVWQALLNIPYGEAQTYKEIASALGNDKASRAVGLANSKNPIPLIIPCHRVIGSNGSLTGFAFGVDMKAELLRLEKANL